jgi:hypothetical protein
MVTCRRLLKQAVCCACIFALPKAGSSNAAKIAMMATTIKSSIKVKPEREEPLAGFVAKVGAHCFI